MGTSSDYGGGAGGEWTPFKHAATNFAKRGAGRHRRERVLARYVTALGGARAAAGGSGGRAGASSAQRVAGFGAGLATQGLTETLEQLGLGHLVGLDRFEVLDGLLEALAGDGATLDDQAILAALWVYHRMLPTLAEKFTHIEDPNEPARRDGLLRERVDLLVQLELRDRDPLQADWRGDEDRAMVEQAIADI